ncbi:MAG TPA: transcription termination/antitermination NusG family protein, partial [Gammaproteobacteria bacterium]|nr:transcription termination/antitermination NusG family protein [Gammaproteobacteria bacterium]
MVEKKIEMGQDSSNQFEKSSNKMHWYVVQARSGYERKVLEALNDRIQQQGLTHKFGQIIVPTEEVVEIRQGRKRKTARKFYPGYVLVEMDMDEDSWYLVRKTPGVINF